jgi:hypothetical protein
MSTRINVTVGDGGLLDRNAQQTAANRQARVLADQRATAEAEGVERRAADRIAAGLDPLTGLPASTPSSASTINRLDQKPAANRRPSSELPFFYLKIDDFQGQQYPEVQVVSGNGNQKASKQFDFGLTEDPFSDLIGPFTPKHGPFTDGQWVETRDSFEGSRSTLPESTSGFTGTYQVETYSAQRQVQLGNTGASGSLLISLPVGDGTSILIVYRSLTYFVWRKDFYTDFTGSYIDGVSQGGVYDTIEYTSEVTTPPTTLTGYAAFRVGMNVAAEIELPETFVAKLDGLFPQFSVTAVNDDTTFFPELRTRERYFMAESYDVSLPAQPRYSSIGRFAETTSQYGISDRGVYPNSLTTSTPLSWFYIDSLSNFATLSGTGGIFAGTFYNVASHQDVLDVTIAATSINSLLPRTKVLGLPTDVMSFFGSIRNMVESGTAYRWADPLNYMDGPGIYNSVVAEDPNRTAYPYDPELNYWVQSKLKFKSGLTSPSFVDLEVDSDPFWRRVVIYDWGSPTFCRQQIARYGFFS